MLSGPIWVLGGARFHHNPEVIRTVVLEDIEHGPALKLGKTVRAVCVCVGGWGAHRSDDSTRGWSYARPGGGGGGGGKSRPSSSLSEATTGRLGEPRRPKQQGHRLDMQPVILRW